MSQSAETQKPSVPVAGQVQLGVDVRTFEWIAVGYRAARLLKSDVYNAPGDVGKRLISSPGCQPAFSGRMGCWQYALSAPPKPLISILGYHAIDKISDRARYHQQKGEDRPRALK